jgi:hypothetical protein
MKWYSNSQTDLTIVNRINQLALTDDISFPVWKKAMSANAMLMRLFSIIARVYGGWQYDDTNYTNFPVTATDLVAGQKDYVLPDENMTVKSVWILGSGQSQFLRLFPATEEQLNTIAFTDNIAPAMPTHYYVKGSSLVLYPAPSYAQVGGLMIEEDRVPYMIIDPTNILTKIGLPDTWHEIVAEGVAVEYQAGRPDPNDRLALQLKADIDMFEEYFMRRWEDMNPNRIPVADGIREVI